MKKQNSYPNLLNNINKNRSRSPGPYLYKYA